MTTAVTETPRNTTLPKPGAARDEAVEGLRALAALMVLYAHLTIPRPAVDPVYAPSPAFWIFETALPGVMLFFIISGYVIGLTNSGPINRSNAGAYLRRRAVRLLPAYFAAVLLGWLAFPGPTVRDLFGNLLFLQNAAPDNPFGITLINGNANLWSLHYEAVYYLGFLALWWLRPTLAPVLVVLAVIATLGVFVPGFSLWAAWLACGALFWVTGLAIAWHLPAGQGSGHAPWPSALLLLLVTWKLQALHFVLARLGHPIAWLPGITFDYLDSLPCLVWLFLLAARRQTRWRLWLEIAAWSLPTGYLLMRLRHGLDVVLIFPVLVVVLAAALRRWQPSLQPLRRLAPLGAISYGLYAFAAPAQNAVHALWPGWSGTAWTYTARVALTLGLTLFAAWLFDHWLQPRLRRFLSPAPNS